MPYASRAQQGYFHANRARLEAQGVNVSEWDSASKGLKLPQRKADGGEIQGFPTSEMWAQQPMEEAFRPKDSNPFNPGPQVPVDVPTPFGAARSLRGPQDQSFPGFGRPEDKSYGRVHDIVTAADEKMRSFLGPGFNEAANKVSGITSMLAPGSGETAAMEDTVKAKQALEEGKTGEAALHGAGAGFNATLGSLPGGALATKLGMAAMAAKAAVKKAPEVASKLFDHGFLDTSNFKSLTGSKGTMEGGFKVDPTTGSEYYVKQAPNLEQAKNEKLTAELYKLAGVPVADVHLTEVNGKPGIASKKIEGVQLGDPWVEHRYGGFSDLKQFHENYPVHAWLANHDAVGTGPENPLGNIMVDKSGQAHVIDTGGGLLYKGTGGKKSAFTPEVNEIHTMDNPDYSYLSAEAFGGRDPMVDKVGAQKIANVDDKEIMRLVETYGPSDKMEKLNLASTLLKRKHNIMEHYGVQPGEEVPKAELPKLSVVPKEESRPAIDEYEQKPFSEEEYQKWVEDKPPPLPDDVRAPSTPTKQQSDIFSQPFATAIGTPQTHMLMSGDKLNKTVLKSVIDNILSGPPETRAWDAAHRLWTMAEHVNPQAAEALFRNLPPKIQVDVGHRIAALRNTLDYSPFNSIAKGSGADGKYPSKYDFYTTSTNQFIPPASVLKDPELKKYADLIEGKKPVEAAAEEPKGKYTPIPNGYSNSWLNAPKEAANLMDSFKTSPGGFATDYDVKGIASELAKLKVEYPYYADDVYSKLPAHIQPAVLKPLKETEKVLKDKKNVEDLKLAETGKFSKELGQTELNNKANSPIGQAYATKFLEPINDWKNWKPIAETFTKPHFKDMTKELLAKTRGFNTNFEIHKGGEFHNPSWEDAKYPTEIQDPSKKINEKAWYASDQSHIAQSYGLGQSSEYILRADKAFEVNWPKMTGTTGYDTYPMNNLIEAARKKGADLVIIHKMHDIGGGNQTQYAVLNPAILRAPNAKFDPKMLHKAMPMAGLVGGALYTYGQEKDDKMNRGGVPGILSRAKKYAGGGSANPWSFSTAKHPRHPAGMIKSSIPGRTDKIPIRIPSGSFVIPADIPSAVGEGNSDSGAKILSKMFKLGPYGSGMTGQIKSERTHMPRFDWMRTPRPIHRADGGTADGDDGVDVIVAGGEMILYPEHVREVGHGDLDAGHKVMNSFVINVRKNNIKTLSKLKPPKMN